jgi:hypothetical protein
MANKTKINSKELWHVGKGIVACWQKTYSVTTPSTAMMVGSLPWVHTAILGVALACNVHMSDIALVRRVASGSAHDHNNSDTKTPTSDAHADANTTGNEPLSHELTAMQRAVDGPPCEDPATSTDKRTKF